MPGVHSERLRATRALVATTATWTKGAYARTASGRKTDFDRPDAVQFCAMGALKRVVVRDVISIGTTAAYLRSPAGETGYLFVVWHDRPETAHDEVLARVDWAIAQAEAEGT